MAVLDEPGESRRTGTYNEGALRSPVGKVAARALGNVSDRTDGATNTCQT